MLPVVLDKRKYNVKSGKSFNKLVAYILVNNGLDEQQALYKDQKFEDILNYSTSPVAKKTNQEKCVAIRTHGVTDIRSATIEMNAVSSRNTRCKDPTFHLVLSWHEHDQLTNESIFDAAQHAIKAMGLAEHQYVLAIHADTDNLHCHVVVNRIHPTTFKSRNIEWANKTLHMAARQSEIKHGWSHDNGIYLVKIDGNNKKTIILNPEHDHTIPRLKREQEPNLSTWQDSEENKIKTSRIRDNSKREDRLEQRAASRTDLRNRFAQYKRLVRECDTEYWHQVKIIKVERSNALKTNNAVTKSRQLEVKNNQNIDMATRLFTLAAIDQLKSQRKLQAELVFQEQFKPLQASRHLPLGWREWLYEQSKLGDQAALSALRGIVYQAQRDAMNLNKNKQHADENELKEGSIVLDRKKQYDAAMQRLLEEEKKEIAIRAIKSNAMRPYEVDALFARYSGIKWRVTGNGNIEYSTQGDLHLFTDRGNRITFDRVVVTDEEIRLALIHAQEKFGRQLTLTGDDPAFSNRMACLADEMGITILNPELQTVIVNQRMTKVQQGVEEILVAATPNKITTLDSASANKPEKLLLQPKLTTPQVAKENASSETVVAKTPEECLRVKILSINPHAQFVIPDIANNHKIYTGRIAVSLEMEGQEGFAQHIGRGVFVLHLKSTAKVHDDESIDIQYIDEKIIVKIKNKEKEIGRN